VGVTVDVSQLRKLTADLRAHSRATPAKLPPIVAKGALNIKTQWRSGWSGIRHAPYLPQSITYETRTSTRAVEAEIGPDEGIGQGWLGRVIHFGGAHSGPHPVGFAALDAEEPRFESAVQKLVDDLLR
jgi:hypothetical protein